MNILIAIAGVVFGGGMIGQLIMFFVKRNDEKNKVNNDDLKIILEKLSSYGKLINDELLSSITHIKYDTINKKIEMEAVRDLISSTSKDTVHLRKKMKDWDEKGVENLEQSRELSKSIEERTKAVDEKLKELSSDSNSGSESRIKELFRNLHAFHSLANILPQIYLTKHKEMANILYDLDVRTTNILIKTEFKSIDDLLELNELLINQLSLIEKTKIVVSNKIKS